MIRREGIQIPELYFRFGLEDIEKGRKAETRRPFTETNIFYFKKFIGRVVKAVEGSRYTYILVINVRRQKLGDLSEEDVRREGFSSIDQFKEVWKKIYGTFNPDEEVVVIEFVHFACWRYTMSRRFIEIEGVRVPLCTQSVHRYDSRCAFCWLSSIEWCGNCIYGEIRKDSLRCRALGEAFIEKIRLPRERMNKRCEFYKRKVPEHILNALKRLRSMGINEVS